MYPVVFCWVKCLKNHNLITMYPRINAPSPPVSIKSMTWQHLTDPQYALLHPKRTLPINSSLKWQLVDLIVTRCSPDSADQKISFATVQEYVPNKLIEWGRVQIHDTGDRAHKWALQKSESSTRDCCFIWVCSIPLSHFLSHQTCWSMNASFTKKHQETIILLYRTT